MALSEAQIQKNKEAHKEAKLKTYREDRAAKLKTYREDRAAKLKKYRQAKEAGVNPDTLPLDFKVGGKVYKVDNSGQQMVAKQYGGKVK